MVICTLFVLPVFDLGICVLVFELLIVCSVVLFCFFVTLLDCLF